MKRSIKILAVAALALVVAIPAAHAAPESKEPRSADWSFAGVFGTFDRAQLQRGYQVYREVCAACHSLNQIYFRNLIDIGLSKNAVEAIAAEVEVAGAPDEDGEPTIRPAQLFDRIPGPYANENAGRAANNGALPPDLSLMPKARHGGPDYVYSLLSGYTDPPADIEMNEGMAYNAYFSGAQIAMSAPLSDDGVEYADGTKATIDQQAQDITAFLMWTAEPKMEERKRIGIKVLLFLLVLTAMLYAVKRRVWSNLH